MNLNSVGIDTQMTIKGLVLLLRCGLRCLEQEPQVTLRTPDGG
jgi:hypothetical protein